MDVGQHAMDVRQDVMHVGLSHYRFACHWVDAQCLLFQQLANATVSLVALKPERNALTPLKRVSIMTHMQNEHLHFITMQYNFLLLKSRSPD